MSNQSKISQMGKNISEYIAKREDWSETSSLGCFFILPTKCVEETNFGQLIISLSNEVGNALWYNCTVKGQN